MDCFCESIEGRIEYVKSIMDSDMRLCNAVVTSKQSKFERCILFWNDISLKYVSDMIAEPKNEESLR